MTINDEQKQAVLELLEAICEYPEACCELDAGCDGEGPVAKCLVAFGKYKNLDEATEAIFGE